jgi:hypothetical protein
MTPKASTPPIWTVSTCRASRPSAFADNEFAIKNRLLQLEPDDKFFVCRARRVGDGIDNRLLDLELAHGVFTADRTILVSQDLGGHQLPIRTGPG